MQKLTWDEVKAAARKAYDEGRLIAQNRQDSVLSMRDPLTGYVCAVGAALSDETIDLILLNRLTITGAETLIDMGIINIAWKDREKIFALQKAHDNWWGFAEEGEKHEKHFLEALGRE